MFEQEGEGGELDKLALVSFSKREREGGRAGEAEGERGDGRRREVKKKGCRCLVGRRRELEKEGRVQWLHGPEALMLLLAICQVQWTTA